MDTQEKIIIYQVFTRLFGNNSLRCKPNGSLEENGCGKMADFTTKALNEIRTLGATHIWYTGIIEHATQTNYTRYGIKPDHPAVVKGTCRHGIREPVPRQHLMGGQHAL